MATEESSNNGSNPSTGGSSDVENLLRQSPWGRLINEVTTAGEIFSGFITATGGGGEGSGPPAGAGTGAGSGSPFTGFGNPNAAGSPLTGGLNPWAAIPSGSSSTSGGGAPTGDSAGDLGGGTTGAPTGGFGGGTTGAPTGGFRGGTTGAPTGGFGGGTTGAPTGGTDDTTGSYSDAFGGATSELEVRMYIDNLVNTNLSQGGITPSFNPPASGEGGIPSPESFGGEGFSEDIFLSIFGIPTAETLGNFGIPPAGDGDQTDGGQAGEYVYDFGDVDSFGGGIGGEQTGGGSFDISSLIGGSTDGGSNPFGGGSNPFAGGGIPSGFGA